MQGNKVDLSKIEHLKLCKYAEIVSFGQPIKCKYKEMAFKLCPNDSGTNSKCNNKCYEYKIKEGD